MQPLTTNQVRILRVIRQQRSPLYRVQIGPIANVAQSDQLSRDLHTAGIGDAIAVVGTTATAVEKQPA